MPDKTTRKVLDRAELELLDDKQLRAILREDASNQKGEGSDLDMILCVLEILVERKRARGEGRDPQAAWEAFCKDYSPTKKAGAVPASTKPGRRLARKLGVAAAALAVVLCSVVTVCSWGFEFFNVEVNWTKDLFRFESINEEDATGTVTKDQEAIRALLPTWVPDGYVQDEYHLSDSDQMSISVTYVYEDKTIAMGAIEYLPGAEGAHEKSDGNVEVYTSENVDYYIIYNLDRLVAVWYADGYDCFIGGNLSNSEMKRMIDSIQKG